MSPPPTGPNNFALHIGIGRYDAPGAPLLPGATHDAVAWAHLSRRHLGFHADRVVLLTDAEADAAGIEAALKDLGARAAAVDGVVLVTFSGHGTAAAQTGDDGVALAHTIALCPHDVAVEDGVVRGAIGFDDVARWLGEASARTTFIADACYTHAGLRVGGLRRAIVTAPEHPALPDVHPGRVILACQPGQEAMEIRAGGRPHGALSFALRTVLEQWTTRVCDDRRVSNASHGELMFRTQQLLRVLGLNQTPMLLGPPRLAMVPVFEPDLSVTHGDRHCEPDGWRAGSQLSAGTVPSGQHGGYRIYQLQLVDSSTTHVVASILVPQVDGPGSSATYEAGKEYWWTPWASGMGQMGSGDYVMTLVAERYDWNDWSSGDNDQGTFGLTGSCNPEVQAGSYDDPSWGGPPSSGVDLGVKASSTTTESPAALELFLSPTQLVVNHAVRRLKHVTWFRDSSSSSLFFGNLTVEGSGVTFSQPVTDSSPYYFLAVDLPTAV